MADLIVALNGIEVGILSKEHSGALSFVYKKSWLNTQGARPISLSLPLDNQTYKGEKVLNFFDNLLPDSESIKTRIQTIFKTSSSHPFDLLAAIGRDCIGAIQLYPIDSISPNVKSVNVSSLTDTQIEKKLINYERSPFGLNRQDDFRISLAGAQEKFAFLWYKNCWNQPLGSTPTSHIFKLPIGILPYKNIDLTDSCENEWLCLKIMKAFGLPAADAFIQVFGKQKALVVERFDRRWAYNKEWLIRIPQEDFCQALGVSPALKYENEGGPNIEQCMDLLLGSTNAIEDRKNFFKAQIIFWLLAAIDGHGKNFSIYLLPNASYRLTPFYDVISAYPLMAKNLPKERVKMAMSVKGKNRHYHWLKIKPRHFISTAKRCGFSLKSAVDLLAEIEQQVPNVIKKVQQELPDGYPQYIQTSIIAGLIERTQEITTYLKKL